MAEFHSSLIGWAVIPGSSCGHVGEFEYYGALDRIPFELIVFALAVVALEVSGHGLWAIVLAVVMAINAALMTVWDQWDA